MSFEAVNTTTQKTTTPAVADKVLSAQNDFAQKENSDNKPQIKGIYIQPKLTVGAPDDPYEREADAVADQVMRMPEKNFVQRKSKEEEEEKIRQKPEEDDEKIQRKPEKEEEEKIHRKPEEEEENVQLKRNAGASFIQKKCEECEKEEIHRKPLSATITPFIQAKSNEAPPVSDSLSASIESSRGGGSALDGNTRYFMENRIGADFGNVKIHTGSESVQMNRELNAQAFTVGNNVYFNEGKFQPHNVEGKKLLMHELTHVVQQTPFIQNKLIQCKSAIQGISQTRIERSIEASKSDVAAKEDINKKPNLNGVKLQPKLTVDTSDDPYKKEADAVADQVMKMPEQASATNKSGQLSNGNNLQRQVREDDEDKIQLKRNTSISFIQRKCAHCEEEKLQRKCASGMLEGNIIHRKEEEDEMVQRKLSADFVQRKAEECKKEEEKEFPAQTLKITSPAVQKKGVVHAQSAPDSLASSIETSKGNGNSMDQGILSFMSSRFNKNFSDVKIHTDTSSAQMNKQLGARAFTVGKNVYFNEGEYQPGSFNGKQLLAHELTHVVQQTNVLSSKNDISRKPQDNAQVAQESVCNQYSADSGQGGNPPGAVNETATESGELPDTATAKPAVATPNPQTAKIISKNAPSETQASKSPEGEITKNTMPDDPAFKGVITDSKKQSKKQKDHVKPPAAKTMQAVDAVTVAKNNVAIDSGATILSVDADVKTQKEKPFDAKKFQEDLKRKIAEAIPDNEKDAKAFIADPQKVKDVSDSTKPELKENEKAIVSGADKINDKSSAKESDKARIPTAPGKSYEPEQAGAKPVINNPERAVPKPLNNEDMQMDKEHNADSLDKAMSDQNVSDNQLAESEEPQFLDTLETKQTSQQELCKIPQKLQDAQNMQHQGDAIGVKTLLMSGMDGMNNTRKDQFEQVQGKQGEVKSEGELRLQEYYVDIKNIYETTQLNVTNSLAYLDCRVSTIFQNAVDKAFETFKTHVHDRLDYYYDWHLISRDYEAEDRWTRIGNAPIDEKIKSLTRKRDSLPENDPQRIILNQEIEGLRGKRTKLIIEKTFDEEKKIFTDSLDEAINQISFIVEEGLTHAKALIDKGRQAIEKENGQLDDENKKKAEEATADFQSKFDDLEGKVNDKESDLKEGLVKQYAESAAKLKDTFESIRKEAAMSWWEKAWRKIKEIVMIIIDIGKLLVQVVVKAAGVIGDIIAHPIRFFGHLIDAVSSGFKNFVKNIGRYLENIIFKLILGVVPPDLTLPQTWDAKGIFSFVLDFFGLSKQNIRAQAVAKFGEPVVSQLEQGFELFVIFKNEGFAGLWEYIKEKIGDLKNAIIEEVKTFFKESIIKAAIEFLLSALTPASGFIKVCKSIISVVTFFIKNLVNILKLLDSILDSFADIVAGKIASAAARVESALADILLIGIKFLAALVGINLDKIQAKISKIINVVRNPVNRVIQWLLDKAQLFAERTGLLGLIRKGKEKFEAGKEWAKEKVEKGKEIAIGAGKKLLGWLGIRKGFQTDDGKQHKLYFSGSEENPVLMVQSNPTAYSTFIGMVDVGENEKKKTAKTKALVIAGDIDQKRKEPLSGDTEEAKEKSKEAKIKEVEKLLDNLSVPTAVLFGDPGAAGEPEVVNTTQGAGHALTMTSKKLNKKQKLKGSPPTSSNTDSYAVLNTRRQSASASYYVKGHMLNDNLGGKGVWENLTPLSREGNSSHESNVESLVKAAFNSGAVVQYNVTAVYGYGNNTSSIPADDPQREQKLKIIAEEKNVPTQLKCDASIMEKKGDTFEPKQKIVTATIANPIGQNAASYILEGTPGRADIFLNSSDASVVATIDNFGDLAGKIELAHSESRKTGKTRFNSYAELSNAKKQDEDGKTEIFSETEKPRILALSAVKYVKLYKGTV